MKLSSFLFDFGCLKEIELVSDEQFSIINNLPIESPDYDLKLSEWLFNELRLISELKKLKEKINKSIQTKQYVPTEILSLNSLDDVYFWIINVEYEGEWNEIDDALLNKLFAAISYIYKQRLNQFYNEKLILLKINSANIQKLLYSKMLAIEKKGEKEILNDFIKYLKDFYADANIGHHENIDGSFNNESNNILPKELDWSPFSEDLLKFYLFLELKYGTNSKSDFSAYWQCISDNELISKKTIGRIRQRFIDWINERFEFKNDSLITKLQTNLSADFLDGLDEEFFQYELVNGKLQKFT